MHTYKTDNIFIYKYIITEKQFINGLFKLLEQIDPKQA